MDNYDYVQVTAETFVNSRKDYRDWRMAFCREILQNAFDSGAENIEIKIEGGYIEVNDNGCGMTYDILKSKLFILNISGKECKNGTVGGFGKAKEILFFSNTEYHIRTQNLYVHGVANRYKISVTQDFIQGTHIRILMNDPLFTIASWRHYFNEYGEKCYRQSAITINGKRIDTGNKSGRFLKEFSFGMLYEGNNDDCLDVLINGIFMFRTWCQGQKLLLELKGNSYDTLLMNREGLKNQKELDDFIWNLAKNTKSAFLQEKCKISLYHGVRGIFGEKKNSALKETSSLSTRFLKKKTPSRSN